MIKQQYLIVYEDQYSNKYTIQRDSIVEGIQELLEDYELRLCDDTVDISEMLDEHFTRPGAFNMIYYDIEVLSKTDPDDAGRIMIFDVEEF